MQPMNILEFRYRLRDLERQAERDEAFISSAARYCAFCEILSHALRCTLRFLRLAVSAKRAKPANCGAQGRA
jgi:hypothetical protein